MNLDDDTELKKADKVYCHCNWGTKTESVVGFFSFNEFESLKTGFQVLLLLFSVVSNFLRNLFLIWIVSCN